MLVSILGTLPALYVAWLAVPGVICSPESAKSWPMAAGRRTEIRQIRGVHQVIGGGPMPTYIRTPHDDLLRAPSWTRQCLRAGWWLFAAGPQTGMTRATYEAVANAPACLLIPKCGRGPRSTADPRR